MVALGLVPFLIGLAAIKLRGLLDLSKDARREIQTKINSLLLCFGAGVLLATCLLHILPEMRTSVAEASQWLDVSWLAELLVACGFFLTYLLEELVHLVLKYIQHTETVHRTFTVRKSGADKALDDPVSACATANAPKEAFACCLEEGGLTSSESENSVQIYLGEDLEGSEDFKTTYKVPFGAELAQSPQLLKKVVDNIRSESPPKACKSDCPYSSSGSMLRDFLTVLALSFHAVFEGLAVGVSGDYHDVLQ